MSLPKWIKEINYAAPKTKGGKEAMLLKSALLQAITALELIDESYTDNQNQDCLGCDFGPVQSTTHHPECTYLVAHKALKYIREIQ